MEALEVLENICLATEEEEVASPYVLPGDPRVDRFPPVPSRTYLQVSFRVVSVLVQSMRNVY